MLKGGTIMKHVMLWIYGCWYFIRHHAAEMVILCCILGVIGVAGSVDTDRMSLQEAGSTALAYTAAAVAAGIVLFRSEKKK